MTNDQTFAPFLESHLRTVVPLNKESALAGWEAATTGSPEAEARVEALDIRMGEIFANPESYALLKSLEGGEWDDPYLQRQHHFLLNAFTGSQVDHETIVEAARLDTLLRTAFNTHRGVVGGKEVSDGDLKDILRNSDDQALRKTAWEAGKAIGPKVRDTVMEFVALRNRTAAKLGFSDYYTMSLTLQDLDVDRVFRFLDELEAASDGPWSRVKAGLDAKLAERFGIAVEDLRPWHYQDPFFQEAPPSEADLDRFYDGKDLEQIAKAFFGEMDLPADEILAKSDLYERPGKNQHAFCTDIDHEGDVRTMCNLRPKAASMGTLCHELGHGVYAKGYDFSLPWMLRRAAHGLMTEAVAILMEYFPRKGAWLERYAGADSVHATAAEALSAREQAVADLTIVRWFLVMCHFERALYANPNQDVDTLWWDMVERFQKVNRPDNRHAPDWCAKIHLALWPAYYHLYPLGGCVASQLRNVMRNRFPKAEQGLGDDSFGCFLSTEIFRHGAVLPWEDLLEKATGERLTTKYWAEEWNRSV